MTAIHVFRERLLLRMFFSTGHVNEMYAVAWPEFMRRWGRLERRRREDRGAERPKSPSGGGMWGAYMMHFFHRTVKLNYS